MNVELHRVSRVFFLFLGIRQIWNVRELKISPKLQNAEVAASRF